MQAAMIAMMILGCDDAATQCHYIDQSNKRWETVAACDAETQTRLNDYSDRNYPVVIAICQPPTNPRELVAGASANQIVSQTAEPLPHHPEATTNAEISADPPGETDDEAAGLTARVLGQIRSVLPEKESVKAVVTSPVRFAGEGYSWVVRRFGD